jgi:hypothetical protein
MALPHPFTARLARVRARWRMIRWALHAMPIAGADDDPPKDDPPNDPPPADEPADDDDDVTPAEPAATEPDWKMQARRHERESKKARKERDDLAVKLKAREDADKSEQEKAIEEAEKRARTAATSEFEAERRKDRLQVETTKLAATGLKVGSGDDAKTVRFADPDDALLHLDRAIRDGDLDPEDIFDSNNRVRADALQEALTDLLARKPHLAADTQPRRVAGTADAGKGQAPKPDSTVEDHFKAIRRHKAA